MTVRWKPLLILSGLFVAVAVLGLMAMAMVMGGKGPGDILARARAERQAKEYDKAKTDYDRALQLDGRNAAIHEEVAGMYEEQLKTAPEEKKAALRDLYLGYLAGAAKHDSRRAAPRRKLLAEAIRRDDVVQQGIRAKEILSIEPNNAEAHFTLAALTLDDGVPNIAEIRRHLTALEAEKPRRIRTDWVAARVAELSKDQAQLAPILERSRAATLPADADPTDRLALLRLRAMDVDATTATADLRPRVDALIAEAIAAASDREIPHTRIPRISVLLEQTQRSLLGLGITEPSARDHLTELAGSIDEAAEKIFQKSLAIPGGAELSVYLAYADHLRFRERREQCMEVVTQGLKSPAAAKQAGTETAMGLHALAVESILGNVASTSRYDDAAPHIKALLECKHERFQALGHLFQGAIDLEKAGLVADVQTKESSRIEQAKLRASALGHLKVAAGQLPHLAEAQARYGVALILSQEPAMGRQYLQLAQRLGNLEPQYQIWAAWSVVQAGYPEDAEPIVARMLQAVEQGRLPKSMAGTLHLLSGEIHQTRRSPEDLKKAIEEYGKAFTEGQDATPAVELRLAQIEVMLGRAADALKRIDWLVERGKAGPAAEQLAILTLGEMGREQDARDRLAKARDKYPDSGELAVLEAGLLVKAKQAEQADKVLADFLARVPDHVGAIQQRAQILAKELKRSGDARKLLNAVADRGQNSAPLVQLALLDLQLRDYDAVAAGIAKIRARWKDAAAADLLDAQLALAKQDLAAASAHFDAALKKDPNNKIVQFWKAQLDGRADPKAAAQVFEALAGEDSIKEVDDGLPLVAASQSALANLAMESGNLDAAITRFRGMLKDGKAGSIARDVRWQLIAAHEAKKDWAAAKAEIASLVNDPKSPPTPEERVRAATYHRIHKDDAAALALIEPVLKADPGNPGAVVTQAEIQTRTGKTPEAIATIRKGIDATAAKGDKSPAVFYLMLAAVETVAPTTEQSYARAIAVLDQGLAVDPDAAELVQAKCQLLAKTQGVKAAATFLEEKAKEEPKGPYRRMLMSFHRERGDFEDAERLAAELLKESPDDASLAIAQVRLVAAQAIEAGRAGDKEAENRLNEREASLIREARPRFKSDPNFPQLEGELELRRGDYTRSLALTQEVDGLAKGSPAGPMLRSQVFQAKGQPREAAAALAEALERNPRLTEARLQLAKLNLQTGKIDEAVQQAHIVSEGEPEGRTGKAALLIEARALATRGGSPAQVQADRARALAMLAAAIKATPAFADAYWLSAEIQMMGQARPQAVAVLKQALKANPDDTTALKLAVQLLGEPRGKGVEPPAADLAEARALAKEYGEPDANGERMLAIASGLHQANRLADALPWAEKAAAKLDTPVAHLGLGDLLLSLSEAQADQSESRNLLGRALAEYDKVLAAQPNAVEAVNNKAWILHSYLGKSQEALELAQGLLKRVDPNGLPGEFFDTLGSIQEKMGRAKDAEESYRKGLGKSPDHPVLNFHMGRLMASDKSKARKAADHLRVAQAGSDRLPAPMVAELNTLLANPVQ
ncbi:tetratricopeptide repeat protein [Tundrisphaera sp. TA3]|uniref:tetratricopeptide repeat protein n=1 Tax=Tundrisphaera sp. TA3 TaxID=3435775 RepID=UPI003EB815F3